MNQPGETPAMEHNCSYDLWEGQAPASRTTVASMDYSTNEFSARAIEKINARAAGAPLYIHLTWQNVHAPVSNLRPKHAIQLRRNHGRASEAPCLLPRRVFATTLTPR